MFHGDICVSFHWIRKILKEIERLRVEQQKQAAFIAAAGSLKHDSSELQDVCDEGAGTLSPTNLKQYLKTDNLLASGVGNSVNSENPRLVADLQALRQRKDELESRMSNLQVINFFGAKDSKLTSKKCF